MEMGNQCGGEDVAGKARRPGGTEGPGGADTVGTELLKGKGGKSLVREMNH